MAASLKLTHQVVGTGASLHADDACSTDAMSSNSLARATQGEYEALCSTLGKSVVNTWGGYWIANALGKVGEQQVPSKKSKLIGSYSILDNDAMTVLRKPKEVEALQLMSDYYQAHRAELPPEVRRHRELIVELLMEGMAPREAFDMVLKRCT